MTGATGRSRARINTRRVSNANLPWNIVAEVYYSGSQTVHDAMTVEYDAASYADFQKGAVTPSFLTRRVANPFYGVLPLNTPLGGSSLIPAYDLLRPFPFVRRRGGTDRAQGALSLRFAAGAGAAQIFESGGWRNFHVPAVIHVFEIVRAEPPSEQLESTGAAGSRNQRAG